MNRGIFQPIAGYSRRFVSQLLVLGAFQAASGAALAQSSVKPQASRTARPPVGAAQPPDPAPPKTYRGLLTGAYVLAPLLARVAGNGVLQATDSEAAAIAVGGLALVLPAGVHVYEVGLDRARTSFGWMLGSMALGALALGGFGYWIGSTTCNPEDEVSESCEQRAQSHGLVGVAAGAGIGYILFAVYDVIHNASVPAAPVPGAHRSTASFWLLPLAPESPELESARPLGLQVGASLQF